MVSLVIALYHWQLYTENQGKWWDISTILIVTVEWSTKTFQRFSRILQNITFVIKLIPYEQREINKAINDLKWLKNVIFRLSCGTFPQDMYTFRCHSYQHQSFQTTSLSAGKTRYGFDWEGQLKLPSAARVK